MSVYMYIVRIHKYTQEHPHMYICFHIHAYIVISSLSFHRQNIFAVDFTEDVTTGHTSLLCLATGRKPSHHQLVFVH